MISRDPLENGVKDDEGDGDEVSAFLSCLSSLRSIPHKREIPVVFPLLRAYVRGELRDPSDCRLVERAVEELSNWQIALKEVRRIESQKTKRVWQIAAAAAALVVMALGIFSVARKKSDVAERVALLDGPGTVAYSNGKLTGLLGLSAEVEAAVVRAFKAELDLTLARALRGQAGVQRTNSDAEDSFDLIYPVGTAVRADRPTLRWKPLDGAEGYEVSVFDSDDNVVVEPRSLPHSQTEWTIPVDASPLRRGHNYMWQVAANKIGKRIVSPGPTKPFAMFRVIDARTLQEVERLESQTPKSRLALGAIYAEAGLLEESLYEFEELMRINQDAPEIQKNIDRIRAFLGQEKNPNNSE